MARYLGLDIGTSTGWALVEGSTIVASGIRDFKVKESEHKGHRGLRFYNFLIEIYREYGAIDEIFYELVQFTGTRKFGGSWSGDNGEVYKGLLMLVNMFAAGTDTPVTGVHNSTLKKAFAGHGRAEKVDMCRRAHELGWRGGKVGTDKMHDEVDACALLITQLKLRFNIDVSFQPPTKEFNMTNEPVAGEQIGQADIEDTAAPAQGTTEGNEQSPASVNEAEGSGDATPTEGAATDSEPATEEPATEAPSDVETPSDYRVSGEHGPAAA